MEGRKEINKKGIKRCVEEEQREQRFFFFFLKARNKQINKTKVIKMRKEDADKQKQTWNKKWKRCVNERKKER